MFILFFTFSLFATAILANKVLLQTVPPVLFVGIRMFISGVLLFTITYRSYKQNLHNLKEDWPLLTAIAFFTTFIPSVLKAYALRNLGAAQATLLGSIDPFITALYGYLLFKEHITITKFIGMLIGFSGIALSLNITHMGLQICPSTLIPQAAALLAVLCSRWGWLMVQVQLRKNRYAPGQINGLVMLESGLIALLAAQWLDPIKTIIIPSNGQFIFLFAYTIIVGNIIAYTLYANLLKHHNATLVSLAGISIPLFVSTFSWLLLGEIITLRFILSAVIFFIGLLIFYRDDLKKRKADLNTVPV